MLRLVCWMVLLPGMLWGVSGAEAFRPREPKAARDRLLRQAKSGPLAARWRAIDRLGRLGDARIIPLLRSQLKRRAKLSERSLIIALLNLGRLRDRKSRRVLESLASRDPRYRVRRAALWSLRYLRSRASVPLLLRLAQSARTAVERQYAIWALRAFRDPSLANKIFPLLLVKNSHICLEAWRMLARMRKIRGRMRCSPRDIKRRRQDKQWRQKLQRGHR